MKTKPARKSLRNCFKDLWEALGIEHRRTRPKPPQTNAIDKHFNARLSDLLRTHRFESAETMNETLLRSVEVDNHH